MVLHDGAIAEMKTGEGKTLTATPAIFLNSLAGESVHVVTVNDYLARRDATWMAPVLNALGVNVGVIQAMMPPRSAPPDVRRGRHLRHQLRVRLRLPARQHGLLARGVRPARPRLRHRRRGRQHPDRRGADAAHHLGPPRAGGRHVRHLRPPRQADGRRGGDDEAEVPRRVARHLRGRARLRVRREAQDRRPHRGRRPQGREVPRRREPLHVRERHARQPPDPVPQGREALQARTPTTR